MTTMTASSTVRFPLGPALAWTVGGTAASAAVVTLCGLIPPDTVRNAASAALLGVYALPVAVLLVLLAWRLPAAATGIATGLVVLGFLGMFLMFWSPVPAVAAAAGAGIARCAARSPARRAVTLAGYLVLAFWLSPYAWETAAHLIG